MQLFGIREKLEQRNLKYACQIKETAKGCRGRLGRKTRGTLEILAQGRLETDGEIDERKAASRFREDEAQKASDEKEEIVQAVVFISGVQDPHACRTPGNCG